jgi:ribosome-associated protein
MIVFEDMGQKIEKHTVKNQWFYEKGIEVIRVPLPVGDYILANDKTVDVLERKEKRGNKPKKMDFLGTYSVAVDTKENIGEIINNICGKSHGRFRDECILAQNNKVQLIILVENEDGVTCLDDVKNWHNPRLDIYEKDTNKLLGYYRNGKPKFGKKQKYPDATDGMRLFKSMTTMEHKYGVRFLFCTPQEAGEKVIELLEVGANDG